MQLKPWAQLRRSLYARLRIESPCSPEPDKPAIVFAPHQDDETLGCGGTIILKRKAATPVKLVFMTDGSTSHRRFMSEDELTRLRNREALAAARILGVASEDVHFLGFADGKLDRCHNSAVAAVLAILRRHRPKEVFVPYEADGTPDHEATYRIVSEAVQRSDLVLRFCEYPVWFWNQWPWVTWQVGLDRETAKTFWRMLQTGFGRALFTKFRAGVFVGGALQQKRQALAQHRSQMTVLKPGAAWPTLADVSNGEFLELFFEDFELFRCRDTVGSRIGDDLLDHTPSVEASKPAVSTSRARKASLPRQSLS